MSTSPEVSRTYQRSAVLGATPIELVVLLYDSAIRDLARALAAMQAGNIERRAAEVGHALMVLQQLQGTLDFDRGGSAARQFEQFYSLLRAKVLEAQMRSSPELLEQQLRYLSEVRDCWLEAKGQLQAQSGPAIVTNPKPPAPINSEWQA